jgi:hypothetical protein
MIWFRLYELLWTKRTTAAVIFATLWAMALSEAMK